jgi:[methyl-Co(III) methanol-specific corrinoid protein]:coenzyme M methyltransferase
MKPKDRVLAQLLGKNVDMTPVGCTTAYADVELMNKSGFKRPLADIDPVAMAGLSIAGHTMAGFDWIKSMGWDISAISEAFGCELGPPAIDAPYYIASHPYAERDIHTLDCPDDLLVRGRFPAYKEQIHILKDQVGDELAIFGMSEGPFTCAANLTGTSLMLRSTLKNPEFVEKALAVTTEAVIKVVNFAFSNGVDYFCIADPTSGSDLLNPRSWTRFVAPAIRKIVDASQGPIVLHICGNADILLPAMCTSGVLGISIEEKTNLALAVEIAHANGVKVFGNISSSSTLFIGTPDECYAESLSALEMGVDFLAPGCGIAPASPLENILQMRRARDAKFNVDGFVPAI